MRSATIAASIAESIAATAGPALVRRSFRVHTTMYCLIRPAPAAYPLDTRRFLALRRFHETADCRLERCNPLATSRRRASVDPTETAGRRKLAQGVTPQIRS